MFSYFEFRKGPSTNDAIFVLNATIQKVVNEKKVYTVR